jgi:flagellar hook-associated protein 1 FlgK
VNVGYRPTDTVQEVINRIDNSGAQVVAYLDRNGKLTLKATPSQSGNYPDFVLRHVQDSGQFLVGYAGILKGPGPAGAYDWGHANAVNSLDTPTAQYAVAPLAHPAGWIELNPQIGQDPATIAAGLGQNGHSLGPGDGSAARAIANLRTEQVMIGRRTTFDEFFASTVADIGLQSQNARQALNTQNLIMKDLSDQKQSISGVNIDQELANMIKFQHGYQAAAQFITVMNNMLNTLINKIGV